MHAHALNASVQRIYRLLWNPGAGQMPAQSGVYLTRNARGQEWFRYFDAQLGDWYMSWAETQHHPAPTRARLRAAELATEVVAWAHRTRTLRA